MRNSKTNELVLTGLFTAIIIIMAFTPLGYIPLVVINATIIHIPVILGSLFCGPKKGAFLGFVFGFTSCLKATIVGGTLSSFVFSPVLAASLVGTVKAKRLPRCIRLKMPGRFLISSVWWSTTKPLNPIRALPLPTGTLAISLDPLSWS